MFGPNPNADEEADQVPERREQAQELEGQWRPCRRVVLNTLGVQTAHRVNLDELGETGWQLAPALDVVQVALPRATCAERGAEDVGRRDRVLDGEVDADPAGWRHRVGGVADT